MAARKGVGDRSGNQSSGKAIEFVISAKNEASQPLSAVSKALDDVKGGADNVGKAFSDMSENALNALSGIKNGVQDLSGKALSGLNSTVNVLGSGTAKAAVGVGALAAGVGTLYDILASPPVLTVFEVIKKNAEDIVSELDSLSNIVRNLGSVGADFGRGFQGKDILPEQTIVRFDRLLSQVDAVDRSFLALTKNAQAVTKEVNTVLNNATDALGAISGFTEPLEIFGFVKDAAIGGATAISEVSSQVFFLFSAFEQIKGAVLGGPFELLIGQNITLQEELLATQATLAATTKIVRDGQAISDPYQGILSLSSDVNATVDQIRRDSLEVVGVTSKELISVFGLVSQSLTDVNLSLSEAGSLTTSFAASLGTIGVPLYQARQEIQSILTGQIDQNSVLAKSIGLTNTQLKLWIAQDKVYERLNDRLSAFVSGNALAAETVGGFTSNIQEIIDEIGRASGEKYLEPIENGLGSVYKTLLANQGALTETAISFFDALFGAFGKVAAAAKELGKTLAPLGQGLAQFVGGSAIAAIEGLAKGVSLATTVFRPFLEIFGELSKSIASNPLLPLFVQLKVLTSGFGLLTQFAGTFVNTIPLVGEALFFLKGRTSPLVNTFSNLSAAFGGSISAAVTVGATLSQLPAGMRVLQDSVGGLVGSLSNLAKTNAVFSAIPLLGGASDLLQNKLVLESLKSTLVGLTPTLLGFARTGLTIASSFGFGRKELADVTRILPNLLDTVVAKTGTLTLLGKNVNFSKFFADIREKYAPELKKLGDAGEAGFSKIEEQIRKATGAAGDSVRRTIIQYGVWAAAVLLVANATNQLVFKNEDLQNSIVFIYDILKDLTENVLAALTTKIGAIVTGVTGLGILLGTGLATAIVNLTKSVLGFIAVDFPSTISNWAKGTQAFFENLSKGKLISEETAEAIGKVTDAIEGQNAAVEAGASGETSSPSGVAGTGTPGQLGVAGVAPTEATVPTASPGVPVIDDRTNTQRRLDESRSRLAEAQELSRKKQDVPSLTEEEKLEQKRRILAEQKEKNRKNRALTQGGQSLYDQRISLQRQEEADFQRREEEKRQQKRIEANELLALPPGDAPPASRRKGQFEVDASPRPKPRPIPGQLLLGAGDGAAEATRALSSSTKGASRIQQEFQIALNNTRASAITMGNALKANAVAGFAAIKAGAIEAGVAIKGFIVSALPLAAVVVAIGAVVSVTAEWVSSMARQSKLQREFNDRLSESVSLLNQLKDAKEENNAVDYTPQTEEEKAAFAISGEQGVRIIRNQRESQNGLQRFEAAARNRASNVFRSNDIINWLTGISDEYSTGLTRKLEDDVLGFDKIIGDAENTVSSYVGDINNINTSTGEGFSKEFTDNVRKAQELEATVSRLNKEGKTEEAQAAQGDLDKVNKSLQKVTNYIDAEIEALERLDLNEAQSSLRGVTVSKLSDIRTAVNSTRSGELLRPEPIEVGTRLEQTLIDFQAGETELGKGLGQPEQLERFAAQILSSAPELASQGQASADQAIEALRLVAESNTLSRQTIASAQDQILQIRKQVTDRILQEEERRQSGLALLQRQGEVSYLQALKEDTKLQAAQFEIRVNEAIKTEKLLRSSIETERAKSIASIDKQIGKAKERGSEASIEEIAELEKRRLDIILATDQQLLQRDREFALEQQTLLEEQLRITQENQIKIIQETQEKLTAQLNYSESVRSAEIQRLYNERLILAEEAELLRAASNDRQVKQEIETEKAILAERLKNPVLYEKEIRQSEINLQQLTFKRLENEDKAWTAQLDLLRRNLKLQSEEYRNTIEEENKDLIGQQKYYEAISRTIEQRNSLLSSANDLVKGAGDTAAGLFGNLNAFFTASPNTQLGNEEAAAGLKIKVLQDSLALEKEMFKTQEAQNTIALKRQQIDLELLDIEQRRLLLEKAGEIEIAKRKVAENPADRDAQLELAFATRELDQIKAGFALIPEQRKLIADQIRFNEETAPLREGNFNLKQASDKASAYGELLGNLPRPVQRQLELPLLTDILRDAGLISEEEVIDSIQEYTDKVQYPLNLAGRKNIGDILKGEGIVDNAKLLELPSVDQTSLLNNNILAQIQSQKNAGLLSDLDVAELIKQVTTNNGVGSRALPDDAGAAFDRLLPTVGAAQRGANQFAPQESVEAITVIDQAISDLLEGKTPTLNELTASADLLIAEKVPTLKEQLDLIAAETLPTTETVLASLGDRLGVLSTEQIPIMQESINAIQSSSISALDAIVAAVDEKAPLIAQAIDAMMDTILDGIKPTPGESTPGEPPPVGAVDTPAATIAPVVRTAESIKLREEAEEMASKGFAISNPQEALRARQLREEAERMKERGDYKRDPGEYRRQQREEAFAPVVNAVTRLFGAFRQSNNGVASAQAAGRSGSTVTVSPTINVSANTRNDATTIAQAVRTELEKVIDKSLSLGTIG